MNAESASSTLLILHRLRRLPALSVTLALLLSAVFWLWQWQDKERYQAAADWYAASGLYALEAENYLSHLAQTRQSEKAAQMEAFHQQGKVTAVAMAIISDRDFAYFMETTDNEFWGESVYPKWHALHAERFEKIRHFSRFKWGLSGADKRPLTFFTHGFLSLNVWDWAACIFILIAMGILLEARIGGLSVLILFTGGTAITGLLGLLGHWQSATPLVGAGGGISVLLGVYLWQCGRSRRDLEFTVPYKGERKTVIIPLFGAYWVIPWLGWNIVEFLLWETTLMTTFSGMILGLLCGWGLQQRMQVKPIAITPSRPTDEAFRGAYDKALNKLSGFDFRGAEEALATLYERYPQRGDVAERLFMLRHYRPHAEDHLQWAEAMMEKLSQAPGNLQNIEHMLQAINEKLDVTPVSPLLLEKLLISATQAQRYDLAVDLAKSCIKKHWNTPVFVKGLRTLAKRLQSDDESVALQFEQIANDLSRPNGASS